jgi:tetratricopeptide (TPR) repeat protein
MGDFERALADYTQALALNPLEATIFFNRGLLYHHLGQREAALADYAEAARLNPQDCSAFYNMACLLAGQNQLDEALTRLRQALVLDQSGDILANAQTDHDLDPLRIEPRFQALLAEFSADSPAAND